MGKIRVGILFGGRSAEHEVSLQSAKSIVEAIDKEKYEVVLIGIDKNGQWQLGEASNFLLNETNPKLIKLNTEQKNLAILPYNSEKQLIHVSDKNNVGKIDVVFPILHGPYGEDGTIQGLLKLTNIPFVGADVTGSAIGMDKDVMKRLLKEAGLPVTKFRVIRRIHKSSQTFEDNAEKLGVPFFVKPANAGSSVGVSKVKNKIDFEKAIEDAFSYDNKIILEQFVDCREIECSVLGNEKPEVSLPGEIIPHHEFYSYEAKYIDDTGAALEIPAKLSKEKITEIQYLAEKAFQTLCCEGMARVDFFMDRHTEKLYVNEINTIPGFTKISMYPKLWAKSGIPYPELIDRLIQLAIERHKRDEKLKSSI